MTKRAASKDALNELHAALAAMMLAEIKECQEGNYPMAAADKNAIIAFLKNNDITAEPSVDTIEELKKTFEESSSELRGKVDNIISQSLDSTLSDVCS